MMALQDPNPRFGTTRIAGLGMLLAFALILSYVETLIPFSFGVPGVKLGLANLAIVISLYMFGKWNAFWIDVLRIVLSGFLFGNMFGMLYSLAGGIISFLAMLLFKRCKGFSIGGVSMAGGVFHNIGQILVAYYIVRSDGLIFYLPILLISGVLTGLLIGLIAKCVLPHIGRLGGKL